MSDKAQFNTDYIKIDLLESDGSAWGNIVYNGRTTHIGMYEEGKIARQLFLIDNVRLEQLVKTLQMLVKRN